MSEQLWMYVGQYVCMKGNEELSQHSSLRHFYICLFIPLFIEVQLQMLGSFPAAWHIDVSWVCSFIYHS